MCLYIENFVFLQRGLSTESGPRSHTPLVLDQSKTIVFIEFAIHHPMNLFFGVFFVTEYSS